MSFHDDSHILSQLGILESNERSPRRETAQAETKSFVDVKLTASVSDSEDDDEDLVFDRNNLLSSTRRQNASLIRGRAENQSVLFLVLILTFLTAGLVSTSSSLRTCSVRHDVIACLWICVGMLFGSYSAKLTSSRSNLMLFLLSTLLTLLVNLFLAFNFAFLFAVRGFFVGATLYGGLLVWFAFWRKQPRKLLIFLFLFSTGGLLSMTVRTAAFDEATSSLADMSVVTRSIQENVLGRLKRAASEEEDTSKTLLPFSAVTSNSTQPSSVSDDASVKKPEVATGTVQKSKTKTEVNAEKEEEVKKKETDLQFVDSENGTETTVASTSSSTSTVTTTSSIITTTFTTTTTTPEPTTVTSTTTIPPTIGTSTTKISPTTEEIVTVDVKTRDSKDSARPSPVPSPPYPANCPSDSIFLSGSVVSAEETTSPFVKTFAILCLVVYFLSYGLFCLPCGLKPDSKVKKLEADSLVGLGLRLRIIIAAIQTMVGFVQQLKHFHSFGISGNSDSDHILICVFVMVTSFILIFGGDRVGSLECVIFSFIIAVIGELILLFSFSSIFGMIVSVCGLYSLWISLFLVIEISLHVRSTVQLAYFLVAWIVGRALACLFVLEFAFGSLDRTAAFLLTIAIGILLFYAVRMIQKSKRLKEILDNSTAPITPGISSAGGEYISLTAQDVLDDDDLLDEDEMERGSMDLDYELEQLGLEPVGVGSRA